MQLTTAAAVEDFVSSKLTRYLHLQWLQRHLQAPVNMESVMKPLRQQAARGQPEQQAVVFEPAMLHFVAKLLDAPWMAAPWQPHPKFGDPMVDAPWRRVVLALLLAFGCVRFKHTERASPVQKLQHGYVCCRLP